MRTLLAFAAILLLGGCNAVTSKTPWFVKDDAVGAPPLRLGVWLVASGKPCQVREDEPIEVWPDCADAVVVRESDLLGLDTQDGHRVWESVPYVLAAGEPRILQLYSASPDNKAAAAYEYAALVPIRLDDQGRVVAFRSWEVDCGPPPPTTDGKPSMGMTNAPFPGLMIQDGDCVAQSVAALRNAAKASEVLATSQQAHWVREGWR